MGDAKKRHKPPQEAELGAVLQDISTRLGRLERKRRHGRHHKKSKRRRGRTSPETSSYEGDTSDYENSNPDDQHRVEDDEPEALPLPVEQPPPEGLDPETRNLIGESTSKSNEAAENIHGDIAEIWTSILSTGLKEPIKESLRPKYQVPANCPNIAPPKLNEEVVLAANPTANARDARMLAVQADLAVALSALGKALTRLLRDKEEGQDNNTYIELLSDAGRLIADIHHRHSETRRALISLELNKELKTTLEKAPRDEWPFGTDIHERVKAAQALERSSAVLKRPKATPTPNQTKNLNSRGLPGYRTGGPRRQSRPPQRFTQPQRQYGGRRQYRSPQYRAKPNQPTYRQ